MRSIPASTAVIATAAKQKDDNNDNEKGREIHVGLLWVLAGTRRVSCPERDALPSL